LALNAMPEEIKNLCRLADISSKSLLLQIVRQPTTQKMTALIEKIATGGATRADVRQDLAKPKPGRPKAYVFNYKAQNKAFNLKLKFRKGNVPRQEVIEALEAILKELRNE
jgi:ParB family chromosome partitioning protein